MKVPFIVVVCDYAPPCNTPALELHIKVTQALLQDIIKIFPVNIMQPYNSKTVTTVLYKCFKHSCSLLSALQMSDIIQSTTAWNYFT